ncbi:MAG: helix-turn-helix transcriptional regulator [Candidatus Atribacteria bacterium]|nr:helix-turn-helix transcriptional regulator [Candidatus Atribacteria bacterium]
MEELKEQGKKLREIREKKGLGLRETAHLASVSPTLLSLVETGKRKPTPTFLSKLAPVLSVPYVELLALYSYYEVDKVDRRIHRLAKEFDADLFEHLEEITSLGEGARKTFCG